MQWKKNDYVVVSFSGGKDSTAMLLRMIELNEQIDEIIYCNTFKEFPDMQEHIKQIQSYVMDLGYKFTILQADTTFDYLMFDYAPQRTNEDLKKHKGYSWPGPRMRWCTGRLKTDVISKYLTPIRSSYNLITCIGIAINELERVERKTLQKPNNRYPLLEWGWNEEQCLQYCYNKGYTWNNLYELFRESEHICPRVSCWCCPLQNLSSLRILRKNFPELWQELLEMETKTWRNFRKDYSVQELDIRFAFEEEKLQQGQSIRNRIFFKELREKLEKIKNE